MALYYNYPVYKDSYDLLIMVFKYIKMTPREYKYTLGERMKDETLNLLTSIYDASKSKIVTDKLKIINKTQSHLEKIRLYNRIFKELKVWSITQQVSINEKVESISKQLNQWEKHTARVQQSKNGLLERAN